MVLLEKAELFERVRLAFQSSGWGLVFDSPVAEHPFRVTVFKESVSHSLIVYIWNLTHGGGEARPADEVRIQLTGVTPPLRIEAARLTLLLGWSEDIGVFAAFDARRHQVFSTHSPSIQIKRGNIEAAVRGGISFYPRGNAEMALALSPDMLPEYVSRQAAFHDYGDIPSEVELLGAAGAGEPVPAEVVAQLPPERRTTVTAVSRLARESTFRVRVLRAYKNSCAACGMQLGLVQAAHIVPVPVPGSSDETSNGLAFCPMHHLGYDAALLAVHPSYAVLVSRARLATLESNNLAGGVERFSAVAQTILLPDALSDRPRPEYLQRAMEIRGFEA